MNISAPFITRPIATTLLMAAFVCSGIAAYFFLPVAPLPQVDFPTIQVSAQLPGASAETMASSVANPLEQQFGQIAGVTQLTSTSTLGNTQINIQFELNRNIDAAAQDVQAAITAAGRRLPTTLSAPPSYRKFNPADPPILIMSVTSDTLPLTETDDYAENILAQQISQIQGVAFVFIGGQQKPAIRIQIDPEKLATRGIMLEEVRGVLRTITADAAKGTLEGAKQSFTIAANDQILKPEDYDKVILTYKQGAPIRISDVGHAIAGPENNKLGARSDGKPAVLLVIFKQPGANVIETVDGIKAALPKLQSVIPAGVRVDVISDRTVTIRASVFDVELTLCLTIALVVLVILIFLRNLRATLIPSAVVPISLLGTFAVMYALGFSLDNLSLMALTIAVGFVVDDAIVVVENIFRHVEKGEQPFKAALRGASEIGFTVFSISLSLVAVFIPLLLMGGIIGRLMREFALTVSATIAVSLFVSLTLTPMLCSRYLSAEKPKPGWLSRKIGGFFEALISGYEQTLSIALRFRFVTLMIFFATLGVTVYLFVVIPKGFFPVQDTGVLYAVTDAPQDISYEEMLRRQQALADIVAKDPDVANVGSALGSSPGNTGNSGRLFITLKPHNERTTDVQGVMNRLRPQLAKVAGAAAFMSPAQDITVGARLSRALYQFTLQDASLEELNTWTPKAVAKLKTLPVLADVSTDLLVNAPQLSVNINRDRALRYGVTPQMIDDTLNDALGQRQVVQYYTQLSTYNVILEVLPELQGSPDILNRIYLRSPITGQMIPLSTLVTFDTNKTGFLSINHQSQFPAATIFFNLAPGVSLGDAVTAINKAMAEIGAPNTLAGSFQGNAQAFQSSLASTPYLIIAALVVIYIILGMLYESFIHPLTILSTLPSAGVGALLMLMAFGFDLSVIGIIGIILLIGIVKKNGIMMVDFAIAAERERGLSPEVSIKEAALLRFRPILMTTMAALLGGLPLMLGAGTGSELRQPLGYAMVGGLAFSQVMTLYTTPVIYIYLDKLQSWLTGHKPEEEAKEEAVVRALPKAAE
jgi:hydrophobic/amphiphilic exporter-1 (mainly G- bacteria), HAE1 family